MKVTRVRGLIFLIGYILVIILCIASPFYVIYILRAASSELHINPEIINGLLTTSSILFGFTTLIVASQKKIDRELYFMLLPPLILIIFSGGMILEFALNEKRGIETLAWIFASFLVNETTTMSIFTSLLLKMKNDAS